MHPMTNRLTSLFIFSCLLLSGMSCREIPPPKSPNTADPLFKVLAPIPIGEKILYTHLHDNVNGYTIRSMRPDGSEKTDLLYVRSHGGPSYALSSDGKRLVFNLSDPSGSQYQTRDTPTGQIRFQFLFEHLWVLEAGEGKQITGFIDNNIYDSPKVWSLDGKRIFFVHSGNQHLQEVIPYEYPYYDMSSDPYEIWEISADGTNGRKITTGRSVSLSPDGKTLAVLLYNEDGWQTILVDSDGQNQRLLMRDVIGCQWSPDGFHLACIDDFPTGDIMIINKEGLFMRQVTTSKAVIQPFTWSPDGQWIGYSQVEGSGREAIYKVLVAGSSLPVLLSNEGIDSFKPQWVK